MTANPALTGPAPDPVHTLEPIGVPLRRLGTILRRRFLLVLLVMTLGLGGMGLYLAKAPRTYRAEAAVLVEPRQTQVSDLQAIAADPGNANLIRTQIDLLRSPALARRVVERLALVDHPAFAPHDGVVTRVLHMAGTLLGVPLLDSRPLTPQERIDNATTALLAMVGQQNEPRSNVITIWAETVSPDLSADIANQFAQQYLEFKRYQKFAAVERAHTWFSERLGELGAKTRAAEQAVENYRLQNGLAEVLNTRNAPTSPTINRQQLDEAARQLVIVSGEKARKEAQLSQARSALRAQRGYDALPEVLNSPLVQRLREQEANLARRDAELSVSLGERAPELMALRSQRRGLQQKLQEEMTNATSGLANEVAAAAVQESALRARLESLRSAVTTENKAEVRLQSLISEANTNRAIYESFLTRATQLANVAGIQEPDAELVSAATIPSEPYSPRAGRLLAVSFGFSLVLGIGLACMFDRMGEGVSTPEALEAELGLASLGLVPSVGAKARGDAPYGRGAADFAAALSRLRGTLQVIDAQARPRVVMITSALPQEGKTVLATSLARNAAQAGWRVCVIDCDLRNPSVAAAFGIDPEPGLAQVLGTNSLSDGNPVVRRMTKGLDVIPTGVPEHDPQELLTSRRLAGILDMARTRYDLVIVDAPPVLAAADAQLLARIVDATLFVVRWERTPRAAARDALRLLRGADIRLLGTVLTQVHLSRFTRLSTGGLAHMYRYYPGYYRPARMPRA
ncbi:Polysaccharide biosynthesis tyrosine autokinase [Rhodovastum atsumiense]|uniref:non-specific protein-tyrosine kinase n=1 Tax=Rhodovastum atsumiense TaxID=504468 RepID=A0A5M6IWT8_9PROT|nr:polysaccharide biosynthesis tyrosine autokinase [Rhodovastum atsumiense]KAA5611928.1 polysaccharide biosynthesis tyrosine autokinase [Rhodovastum atsumiense]CAH2598692.1 Polysaccharide biosynthesis tyrosine autokinase [Rhodovastum atsumiense]